MNLQVVTEVPPALIRSLSFSLSSHLPHLSHRQHLLLTALAASLGIAALFSGYSLFDLERRKRDKRRELLRSSVASKTNTPARTRSPVAAADNSLSRTEDAEYDEELIKEQLARNYAFFGKSLWQGSVTQRLLSLGVGKWGSWAAVMLVRSGVSHIRLVDFDYMTLSSLNRHATAPLADVGTKVACFTMGRGGCEGGRLAEGQGWPRYSTVLTSLLSTCYTTATPARSPSSPPWVPAPRQTPRASRLPTSRTVRRRLRLLGVCSGIPVVYSTEVPGDVKLLPLPEDKFAKGKSKARCDRRLASTRLARARPAAGDVWLECGDVCARRACGEADTESTSGEEREEGVREDDKGFAGEGGQESGRRAWDGYGSSRLPIDEDDIALIFEDIHRGRSVIPPHPVLVRPTLVRWTSWNPAEGLTLENVVVMEQKEAAKHEAGLYGDGEDTKTESGLDLWGAETDALVQKRREEARRVTEWVDW
ncbi:ubiquitin-protein ligase molybdopterin-converting factor [Mycena amicta]|nr:ubiquitin-protein ligase molybdopterin-converting factor [Mycena amicta]